MASDAKIINVARQRLKRQRQQHGYKVSTGNPERAVQRKVEKAFTLAKWKWRSEPDSRRTRGHPGFPDVFATKRGYRPIAVECKSETGKLSPQQCEWLENLQGSGAAVWVVRPSNVDTFLAWFEAQITTPGEAVTKQEKKP